MQVVRKDTIPLHTTITITLEPQDYRPSYESECKKYRNKVQLKGFRKGNTPIDVIKKMYGKAILSDVINEELQKALFDYCEKENIKYLGAPLGSEVSEPIVLDHKTEKDYVFSFDLGLTPEFHVTGIDDSVIYDKYDIQITDDIINEEINKYRNQNGNRIEAEDTILENDYITIDASEKDGDYHTDISLLVKMVANESFKNELLTKKHGDTVEFDVFTLEDSSREQIQKYILKKPADMEREINSIFTGKIIKVSRIVPLPIDEELFKMLGDESITDEQSMREFFKKSIKDQYDIQADNFMYRNIMDRLLLENKVDLPDTFLKRYLLETNDKLTAEQVDQEYDSFAKNMKWSLIKNNLGRKYEITVSEKDIKDHFTMSVFRYMRNYGFQDYSFVQETINKLMKDEKQVNEAYEEILASKVFEVIGSIIQKNMVPVSIDEFNDKVKELNSRINK
jgi:trigger factor